MTRTSAASASDSLPFLPLFIDLRNKPCLVVGAGSIAAAKLTSLLQCGAHVELVSPRAVREITERACSGEITWHQRSFVPADVQGKFLVIAATGSTRTNQRIFRACSEQGILCNAVDDPRHCGFFFPAVVRRGPLQIAISTGGRSPSLAARLKRELEIQFGREWGRWVEHLGKQRHAILAQEPSSPTRRRRLQQIATPQAFRAFLRADARRPAAVTQKSR
ncbi:MAG: bifunctional precorrin-2 dehydrogenase/sirohydrochlorin ferrochelatase [Acidobacteriota bacterium]